MIKFFHIGNREEGLSKVMSRKQSNVGSPVPSYGFGYVVYDRTVSAISGRVVTLIETLGLPQKQEEAIKGLVFQAVDQAFYDSGYNAIFLSEEKHKKIREDYQKLKEEANRLNQPVGAL